MKARMVIAGVGVAAWVLSAAAQEGEGSRQGPPRGRDGKPPTPPVEAALDANSDGTIDADEIANAPAALKKLDKNGDGALSADECRPAAPAGRGRR
jgi:hypothetical protein